jgi:hypothetical protein
MKLGSFATFLGSTQKEICIEKLKNLEVSLPEAGNLRVFLKNQEVFTSICPYSINSIFKLKGQVHCM